MLPPTLNVAIPGLLVEGLGFEPRLFACCASAHMIGVEPADTRKGGHTELTLL